MVRLYRYINTICLIIPWVSRKSRQRQKEKRAGKHITKKEKKVKNSKIKQYTRVNLFFVFLLYEKKLLFFRYMYIKDTLVLFTYTAKKWNTA